MSGSEEGGGGRGIPPLPLLGALLAALPGSYLGASAYLGLAAPHPPPPMLALVYGAAIIGAAFALSWAAEAAQVDVSAGLALAVLALLAVLPEYAVDFVFTVRCGGEYAGPGGSPPEVCGLALANMTGANRILVGIGWPLVVLVGTVAVLWRRRRAGAAGESPSTHTGAVRVAPGMAIEITFLGAATLYSLTLPLRSRLTLADTLILVAIFAGYAWRLARLPAAEPELLGVSQWVGARAAGPRRAWVAAMFALAALVILLAAEHFADALVSTGDAWGVSRFLLVQWVAPLASESPELIVACLYAWRLQASDGLGALLSSKVNQWTLLVGGLPLVFTLSALTFDGIPLDREQRFELLITAAQSLFAVSILVGLCLTFRGALALLGLFTTQMTVSVFGSPAANRWVIVAVSSVYVVLAVTRLWRARRSLRGLVRDGLRTPPRELV